MIKIKEKIDVGSVNVDLIITTDHTGGEVDFPVRISRELLAGMTPLELKILLTEQHKAFYRDYLDLKVDELVTPLLGVDFSGEDLMLPPEPKLIPEPDSEPEPEKEPEELFMEEP